MSQASLVAVGREALVLMIVASAPPLIASMLAWLLASALQAVFSLQESTLSVVPKLGAAMLALVLAGPWIGAQLARFASQVMALLPTVSL